MNGGLNTIWQGIESGLSALSSQPAFGSAALFLALVFAISAMPKLRKPELAAMAIVDFGVTEQSHRSAGLALGGGEMALAVALAAAAGMASHARAIPMVLAGILLWSFVVLIGRALRAPERFSCFCFGSSEDSISALTLLRAGGLALLATGMSVIALSNASGPDLQAWTLEFVIAASVLGAGALVIEGRSTGESAA